MTLIVKIMHGPDDTPGGENEPHSLYGDVLSIHFPERGAAQVARMWVREPVKTALVPGFVEHERYVDLSGPVYVMNESGRTISSFKPLKPGGDPGERYQFYDGYQALNVRPATEEEQAAFAAEQAAQAMGRCQQTYVRQT